MKDQIFTLAVLSVRLQVLVSSIFQVVFTITFGSIYPIVNLEINSGSPLLSLFPALTNLPRATSRKLVFTSLYDTSITIAISVGVASFLTSKTESGLYQLSYLGFLLELNIGCLVAAYTLIGKHSRHPRARFLAALPAWGFFIAGQVRAKQTAKGIMSHSVLPFFATIGVDCPQHGSESKAFETVLFPDDPLHLFNLLTFFIFVVYFFICALSFFLTRHLALTLKAFVRRSLVVYTSREFPIIAQQIIFFAKAILYALFYSTAVIFIYRLMHLRNTFHAWYQMQGQSLEDSDWGYGQILAVLVWGNVLWEVGLGIAESMMPDR